MTNTQPFISKSGQATRLLEVSIDRLRNYFHQVIIPRPVDDLEPLLRKLPEVPDDLRIFYSICDGIKVGLTKNHAVEGEIFSVKEMLGFYPVALDIRYVQRFIPIRGDGCGNNDCLVAGPGIGANCVIFWDHEVYIGPAYLLGSSLFNYLDMWSDYLVHRYFPDGRMNPKYDPPSLKQWPWIGEAEEKHPWPFDQKWMLKRDPGSRALLTSPKFKAWLIERN